MKKNPIVRVLGFTALTLICACSSVSFAGTGSSAGVPNPAAVWCDRSGGTLVYYKTADGDFGVCQLERAQVEEWTFYKATGSNGTTEATQAFINHVPFIRPRHGVPGHVGMPNPSAVYCHQVGGESKVVTSEAGESGFCKFSDNSQIEEWTLFGGPDAEGHAKLAALLGVRTGH